ncbi:MAG: metallophosphoesterase family protein [Acidobacteriota bacterium]
MVVGDTHGKCDSITSEIRKLPGIDLILHTGDFHQDGIYISKRLDIETKVVVGNCDHGVKGSKEILLKTANRKILITHGHEYNVKHTLNNLYFRAREKKADIILYGHTHIPNLENMGDMWFMNPGSPTYPRGGSHASYGIIEIADGQVIPRLITV